MLIARRIQKAQDVRVAAIVTGSAGAWQFRFQFSGGIDIAALFRARAAITTILSHTTGVALRWRRMLIARRIQKTQDVRVAAIVTGSAGAWQFRFQFSGAIDI